MKVKIKGERISKYKIDLLKSLQKNAEHLNESIC